jgi:hypothetical protein
MKKALVILGMAALVASANAGIRFFFTTNLQPYGLTNAANALKPSAAITSNDDVPDTSDNQDYTSGAYAATFPTYSATVPTIDLDTNPGGFVYLWMQFYNDGNADASSKFLSGEFLITGGPVNPVYYRGDDLGGLHGSKLWDGASTEADNYSTFRQNPQTLAAITAAGIVNSSFGSQSYTDEDDVQHRSPLWTGGSIGTGRMALLGAIQPLGVGTYHFDNTFAADTSSTVVLVRAGSNTPVDIAGIDFTVTPEPASMALMALAGLLIRRR